MEDRSIIQVYGITSIDGAIRAKVRLRTSFGFVYMRGWRMTSNGKLYAPSIALKGGKWLAIVKVPKLMRAAIRNKMLRALVGQSK